MIKITNTNFPEPGNLERKIIAADGILKQTFAISKQKLMSASFRKWETRTPEWDDTGRIVNRNLISSDEPLKSSRIWNGRIPRI